LHPPVGLRSSAAAVVDSHESRQTETMRSRIPGVRAASLEPGGAHNPLKKSATVFFAVVAARKSWYRETGSGMGPALDTAAELGGYILTDRATWLSFKNRRDLAVLVEGDERLFNQYGVIRVNPARYPSIKADDGQRFIEWLISPAGQQIVHFRKVKAKGLWRPNYFCFLSDLADGRYS
jgi:hypothetical protein